MNTPDATTATRSRPRRRLFKALLVLSLLIALGYWLYPAASNQVTTLDGKQTWSLAEAPPRRQIIWQRAHKAPLPKLPAAAQESALRPQLSPDGKTLYLTLRNQQHDLDIYQTHWADGRWQAITRIETLASAADDIGPTLSYDGATLYFYSDRPGGQGGFDLYQSLRTADGWAEPVNLGSQINTIADEIDPCLTPDGKSLYFSSNHSSNMSKDDDGTALSRSPDRWTSTLRAAIGLNQHNLYRSRRTTLKTPWETAKPLSNLNRSDANDGAPFIDPTGSFLYFSSDRPQANGLARNFDIYRARLRKVGHGSPENLGEGINTSQHELEPSLTKRGFEIHFSRSQPDPIRVSAPPYLIYRSDAVEVEVHEGRDYSQLAHIAALFRRLVFGFTKLIATNWWWICLLLLLAALLASLVWYLRKISFQRAGVPVFFVWAMAIHLILGAGSFYVYFDSELLKSVKKTFRSMMVASKLPSEELHQSHKPGQEAYEKVADLKSVQTVETSDLVRQVTEAPNVGVATDSAIPQLPTRTAVTLDVLPRVQVEAVVQEPIPPQTDLQRKLNVQEAIAEKSVTIDPLKALDAEVTKLVRPRTAPNLTRRTPAQPALPNVSVAPATPTQVANQSLAPSDRVPDQPAKAIRPAEPLPLVRQESEPVEQPAPLQVASLNLPAAVPVISEQRNIKTPSLSIKRADNALILSPQTPLPNTPATKSMVRANAATELARQLNEPPAPTTVISPANVEAAADLAKASPPASASEASRTLAKLIANPTQQSPQAYAIPQPTRVVELVRQAATPLLPVTPSTVSPAAPPTKPDPITQPTVGDIAQPLPEPLPESLPTVAKATDRADPTPTSPIEPVVLPAASDDGTAKNPASITPPKIEVARSGALPIPLPPGQNPTVGGPVRPSNTRIVLGSVGREAINAPLTRSPIATALLRTPARAPTVLYAEDNIGLQAMLRLRNVEREAKLQLIEQFGGSEKTLETVNRTLKWIALQQHDDGHWDFRKLRDIKGEKSTLSGGTDATAAATGFGLLPLLGNGNTHQKGPYKDHVQRGVQWLLKTQQGSGEFKRPGTSNARMYSHGVATIAICEAYAMSGDAALKAPAQKAIDFIVKAQHKTLGGWRYNPGQSPDTSVVGWQVMAIKSAQMANLAIPAETLDGVRTWLDRVAGKGNKLGQFGYTSSGDLKPTMSAEALLCHQYLDMPRHDPTLEAGARYLKSVLPRAKAESSYYWYYATQVMFHLQGDEWKSWNQAMKPLLLNSQVKEGHEAGSWPPGDQWDRPGGRLLATSLRVLILEVYFRHLPLYKFDE